VLVVNVLVVVMVRVVPVVVVVEVGVSVRVIVMGQVGPLYPQSVVVVKTTVVTPLEPTIVVDPSRPMTVVPLVRVVTPVAVVTVLLAVVAVAPLVEVTTGPVSPTNPPCSSSAVLPPHAASAVPAATSQDKPYFAIVQKR
jgi:hypothetical protein